MAVQLKSTHGFGAQEGVKVLVYGRAGVGKTTLCATAPNPVILSAEGGLLSLARHNVPYIEIKTLEDLHEAYRWATTSSEARQFQTICLDSISEMGETILANAKIGVSDPRQAYGKLIDRAIEMLKKFRDIHGFHVYASAKQEQVKNDTGVLMNTPMMPGSKLGPQLPYLFDEVFMLGIETPPGQAPYRYLRTQPDLLHEAKDRSGRLNSVEEPHLTKVIDKILGVS